jgi:hypothetical protein
MILGLGIVTLAMTEAIKECGRHPPGPGDKAPACCVVNQQEP